MQDNERSVPEHFLETIPGLFLETIPWLVMAATWLGSIMMVAMSQGRLAGLISLWAVAVFCLSLAFSRYRNRRWLHKILAGADDIGEVTHIDTARYSWLLILWLIFTNSAITALWLVAFSQSSLPMYPVLIVWVTSTGWSLYITAASPIQYIITTNGIGVQAEYAHWFVYFADLEQIHCKPGRQLTLMYRTNLVASPVAHLHDFVILYLKPERTLATESRVRCLTPANPSRFLLHLPPELVKRSDEA